MTIYDDFREILVASFPLQMAIDKALRPFPTKLTRAIRDYMVAPEGPWKQGATWFNCDTDYVDLYKPVFDQDGHRRLVRDARDIGDGLYVYDGHEYKCCIGICFDNNSAEHPIITAYMLFSIVEFDENSITFCIDNLEGQITIENVNDPMSYSNAAKLAIDRLIEFATNPPSKRGLRAPIGFQGLAT